MAVTVTQYVKYYEPMIILEVPVNYFKKNPNNNKMTKAQTEREAVHLTYMTV